MKQELFKEMYDEIQLDSGQKKKIWKELETREERGYTRAGKRYHTPAFAAICMCVILIIGVPVLAANTPVVQSIINAFNTLAFEKPNLTKEQKSIYAKYGSALENEIALEHGTLKLEAIINDGRNVCISFSMDLKNKKGTETGKLSAVPYSHKLLDEISDLGFYLEEDRYTPLGKTTTLDRKLREDGAVIGCYLLYSDERKIKQGEVLQLKSHKRWEEEEKVGKSLEEIEPLIPVISEVTMNAPVKEQNIPVKSIQKKLRKGTSINKVQLTPISLRLEGIEKKSGIDESVYYSDIEVKLKDGSTVKECASGCGGGAGSLTEEYFSYTHMLLFEAPINPDDVAGIQIQNRSLDLWIPFTN